jgi:hypothetical protein
MAAMRQPSFIFVTESSRNHLGTGRAPPHRVLLSPHQNFLNARGCRAIVARWGFLGVLKIKRISCVCFNHPRSAGRLSRWRCVRPLSLPQPHRLRRGRIIAHGGRPMPMIRVIMSGGITPFAVSITWRASRAGMPALPHCGRAASRTPMPACRRKHSQALARCQAALAHPM